jgi:hypothetical protein
VLSFRRNRIRARRSALGCETLENRVVLTAYAGPSSLLGSLSYVGVVTTPIESVNVPELPIHPVPATATAAFPFGEGISTAWAKLRTDLQTLETELQTLAAKSGLTVADLENLTNDSEAIGKAGFYFAASALNPVISELAVAVAGNASTSQAQSDFTGLFTGSTVSSTTITNTFNDLVKAIQDSAVTTSDLSTVAADEAAIQSDFPKIPSPMIPAGQTWLDQVGSVPGALSLATQVTSATAAMASPILPIVPPQPIIVSRFGGVSLLGSLSSVGVVTSPVFVPPTVGGPVPLGVSPASSVPPMESAAAAAVTVLPNIPVTSSGAWAQLQADVQKLHAELVCLAEKSGLTIADEQSLANDAQAITQAGFYFKESALDPVISELAVAVAGGNSTSQALTDFTALFSGSSVSSTTITNTFNDLVKAIKDSGVTTNDLSTVAADQAAIQADLKNLFPGEIGGGEGSGGGGVTGTGTGSGGTTGSGSTGGSGGQTNNGGHGHKGHHGAHVTIKVVKVTHGTKVGHAVKVGHAAKELSRAKKR